jgi:hypothetical protein
MILHSGKRSLVGAVINARMLPLIALVVAMSGTIASPQASADALAMSRNSRAAAITGGGHGHSGRISMHGGNGKHAKNDWQVLSPTIINGSQAVDNTNLGGKTSIQTAACGKRHSGSRWRNCKISQKLWARW